MRLMTRLRSNVLRFVVVLTLIVVVDNNPLGIRSADANEEEGGKLSAPTVDISRLAVENRNKVVSVLLPHTHVQAGRLLAKEFKEKTGISVLIQRYDYKNFDVNQTIQSDLIVFPILFTERLSKNGRLTPLTDNPYLFSLDGSGAPISEQDFLENFWNTSKVKGTLMAIPFDGDTHFIIYRKSWFQELGLSPPVTWQEFNAISTKIASQKKGKYGTSIMAFPSDLLVLTGFFNRYFDSGKEVFKEGQFVFDWQVAEDVVHQIIELKQSAMPSPEKLTFFDSVNGFLAGQVAMVEQWADLTSMADDKARSNVVGDWGIAPLPNYYSGQRYPVNAGWSIGINQASQNKVLASVFLRFAFQPSIRMKLNTRYGSSGTDPVMKLILNSQQYYRFNPQKSRIERSVLPETRLWFRHEMAPEILDLFTQGISRAISERVPVHQAMAELKANLERLLSSDKPL